MPSGLNSALTRELSNYKIDKYVRVFDPKGVRARKLGMTARRVLKWVSNFNYMWSLNGYLKMEYINIKIYVCVDAFSRKLLWIYFSHSAKI
jgi:hypothetical protein